MLDRKYAGLLIPTHRTIDAASKEVSSKTLTGWIHKEYSVDEWIIQLEQGRTIQPSLFKPTREGTYTHNKRLWQSTNLICADADNIKGDEDATDTALEPWTEKEGILTRYPFLGAEDAYAIGQSVSSMSSEKQPEHRRYRIIFVFDEPITTPEHYNYILSILAERYPIIPQVSRSPAQPVFGNARPGYDFDFFRNILTLSDFEMPAKIQDEETAPYNVRNSNLKNGGYCLTNDIHGFHSAKF